MAYTLIFRTATRGNTTVVVEDLAHSGRVCTHCHKVGQYPGTCDHCGKVHIRYLAHVKQDVADTLLRATKEDVENPVQRTDEQIAELGIALLGGKTKKEAQVGCVCVAEYLVDCGVDAGVAARFQSEVGRVTYLLQKVAALEACKSPERLAESLRRYEIVKGLRERVAALRAIRAWDNPVLRSNPDAARSFQATQNLVYKDYSEASERWQTENQGFYGEPTEEALLRHFNGKIRHYESKLARFERGASFVA